jgi:O-antigen ligase
MVETAPNGLVIAQRLSPHRSLLMEIAVCSVPPMALLALSQLTLAGLYFFLVFLLLLAGRLVRKDPKGMMCLIIGCMPPLMLFRNSLSYSSVEVILALGVFTWFIQDQADLKRVFSDRLMVLFSVFVLVYWLVSFARTGDYSANLRAFELLLTALGIRLLGRYRSYLGTALIGLAISTFAMGLSFARFGDRLGMAKIDGEKIGNPISFGIPMALIFLLSLAEDGRWLMLQDKTALRFTINIGAGILLLLSTSRGSWAAVAACLVVLLVGQRNRGKLIKYIAAIALVLAAWFYFADAATLDKYIFKTFYSSAYWSVDTNARVAQWASFPRAFGDSPVWGFGPGSGKSVSLQYCGLKLIWHALYLHMAIECGLIGIALLACFLLTILVRSVRYVLTTGEYAPLLGIVSFMVVGCTIPAIDGASGLFLGCGLLSFETSRLFVVRAKVGLAESLELPALHGARSG